MTPPPSNGLSISLPSTAPEHGILAPNGQDIDELLLQLLAPLQHLSSVRDPHEMFRLGAVYTADGSISDEPHAMLVVSTDGLSPGEYRITRKLLSIPRRRSIVEVAESDDDVEVHHGGFIASILRKRQPELLRRISLAGDPVLGSEFRDFDSCLLLPLFSNGRMCKRVLVFRRGWTEVEYDHVERSLLILNLIESSIESVGIADRNAELARVLDMQFEQMSRIQRRLLPRTNPERPGHWDAGAALHPSIDVGMHYQNAERAGGDYFNFFRLPDGRLMALIADVAGHGADAAMVMGMLHALVHGEANAASPAALIAETNRRLMPLLPEGRFVTAAAVLLEPGAGVMRYCSAGHPAPRLLSAKGKVSTLAESAGDVIGLLDDPVFPEVEVPLAPGDRVVLYTDGLPDSLDPTHRGLGASRLEDLLTSMSGASAAEMAVRLVEAANEAVASGKSIDDITVVVLGVRG